MVAQLPEFTDDECVELLRSAYGLSCRVKRLPGDRDLNVLVNSAEGNRFVLKIADAEEDGALFDAQNQAMNLLSAELEFCPHIIPTVQGDAAFLAETNGGGKHWVRLVRFFEGVPMGKVKRQSLELFNHLGECLGELDRVLSEFDHKALHKPFVWDLARAPDAIDTHLEKVKDRQLRELIKGISGEYADGVVPLLTNLKKQVIHNDANDFNVIVTDGNDLYSKNQKVMGLIDFGDLVYSHSINELAIAVAYGVLDKDDPLAVATALVAGYNRKKPLEEDEIAVLFSLAKMRLCVSACMAAYQHSLRPDDPYLLISQEPIRRTLPRLATITMGFAQATFRHVCGFDPVPKGKSVSSWLASQKVKPVLGIDLSKTPCAHVDLGVGSPLVAGDLEESVEPKLTPRVLETLEAQGARVGVGVFGEARILYQSPLFSGCFSGTEDPRTIHVGVDLFCPSGAPVFSPLDGSVFAFAKNPQPLDYGHVILLSHETPDGETFFTLYGHLSSASLDGLSKGQKIAAGEQIATLGTSDENGGWTPHLHFQVILDHLDLGLDFPGVCTADQFPVWRAFSPEPYSILGIPKEVLPETKPSKEETQVLRRKLFGGNLSLGYGSPLKMERGWMQYLYDQTGRRYLDAYNNVPHVGHCHPRVVAAAHRQMHVLNTNTRYLSDLLVQYGERLCATMPDPLNVCFFVNSASEGNELALRLARAHTGARDLIVQESAYHGHTTTLIDISPYKHAGPGGRGAPSWVHVVPIPDGYRGPHKWDDPEMGTKYAAQVKEIATKLKVQSGLCGFMAETCPSVGGQIFLPDGYLSEVYDAVRSAGGVCIADEVQTGYGRIGTHFYAFEAHDVVPDIVVLGKPIANGHPVSAVVTTREIASAFDNGMEFFSTFGGNTVSCAVGLEALKVVQEESLQDHALEVGMVLLRGLGELKDRFDVIGDVRGSGLFFGVELVKDRETLEPATEEAAFVANRMRDLGVLIGTDGPFHNVLKIRPPMPFDKDDAKVLLDTLEKVLLQDFDRT